jgi:hypothetical protein
LSCPFHIGQLLFCVVLCPRFLTRLGQGSCSRTATLTEIHHADILHGDLRFGQHTCG